MIHLLLGAFVSSAFAAWVPEFAENWDASNVAAYSGTNAWVSGFSSDSWTTNGVTGVAALTDINTGGWGGDVGADNHLVKTDLTFADFQMDFIFRSNDNDTAGVVFRYQDASNFYLAFMSNGAIPRTPDGEGVGQYFSTARFYRVQGGVAVELAQLVTSYTQGQFHNARVLAIGNGCGSFGTTAHAASRRAGSSASS